MTRRELLKSAAAGLAAASRSWAAPRTQMGVATTCYLTVWRPRDNHEFLEHCIGLGAGGVQLGLSSTEASDIKKLRSRAEQAGMYMEVFIGLPKKADDEGFEKTLTAAKEAGALCVRAACLGGRRYETFSSLTEWRTFVEQSHAAVDRAVRLAEKHKLPLALENHKDWTADEMAALVQKRSSEFFGVCLDTGNNISLLDDPMEVVEKLAPYAISTHVKDMGVEPYADGFLLSEMPFGEGFMDMKRVVETIRRARPKTRITLEMITRNPLKVPCLTEKYWATFPDRNGRVLARTLALVREKTRQGRLPYLDGLPKDAQMRVENDNVKQCLHYAREQLGL